VDPATRGGADQSLLGPTGVGGDAESEWPGPTGSDVKDGGGGAPSLTWTGPRDRDTDWSPPTPVEPTTDASADSTRTGFVGYPALEAPAGVTAGDQFLVRIGLSAKADNGTSDPIEIPDARESELNFVVQLFGSGFEFPAGVRHTLVVPRTDPGTRHIDVAVVAKRSTVAAIRVLQVAYSYRGNVCGLAWREIRVDETAAGVSIPVGAGATGMVTPPADQAPHLTVTIRAREGDPELEWLFTSRYADLDLPTKRVTNSLDQHDAQSFAIELMEEIKTAASSMFLDETLRGIGRRIAAILPPPFWDLMVAAWTRAKADNQIPRMLIITNEPYVPWELAWLETDNVEAALLPVEGTLGSHWRIGRWVPPITRTRLTGDRPPMPPETSMRCDTMAVVIGDYASDVGIRPLPKAVEEGEAIATRYRGMRLTAVEADVQRLLDNTLERNGEPYEPSTVHFACHGQVDLQNPSWTGIVLGKRGHRLSPVIVQGSRLPRIARPFVFLNACQVGTAGEMLSTYGGMAGAFLAEGCRGFLAPLWNVDDTAAHDIALWFYEQAINSGTPIAEILRQVRAGLAPISGASNAATQYAYVFYGHPELTLEAPGGTD
jgi:CHAT domain